MNKSEPLLSKSEASNLAEFIEINLLDIIRNNDDIDNIGWLRSMLSAYDKLKEYSGYVGIYDPIEEGGE